MRAFQRAFLAALVLGLGACLSVADAPQVPTVWSGYGEVERAYVEPRLAEIAVSAEPPDAVLFVGDSITQGADLAAMFPSVATSNHGVAADRTQGVLWRMDQITRGTPEKIFLLIGTNDLHQPEVDTDAIAARIADILETLSRREPQATIHVVGVLPREPDKAASVAALNAAIARAVSGTDIVFLDLTSRFTDGDGALPEALTYDGLHLNAAGYARLADGLRPCVEGRCEP